MRDFDLWIVVCAVIGTTISAYGRSISRKNIRQVIGDAVLCTVVLFYSVVLGLCVRELM